MSSGKHAVPPAVSAAAALAAAAAVPVALSGVVSPAVPAAHAATAVLDARIVQKMMPAPRPLVTRIVSASAQKSYTVVSGNTLSGIAGKNCGNPARWPALWEGNKAEVKNPDMIYPGQKLRMTCAELTAAVQAAAVQAAAPADPAPAVSSAGNDGKVYGYSYGDPYYCSSAYGKGYDIPCQQQAQQAAPQPQIHSAAVADTSVNPASYGGYQQCVITRESGGNSQVMNGSGHYGLYQFDYGTWVSGGGAGGDFGHASVAEQNRVFASVYAARGTQPWSPSDGC